MTTEPPVERRDPRSLLALIILAVELPLPRTIDLYGSGRLFLTFDSVAAGLAWVAYLGGQPEMYVYEGRQFIRNDVIVWEGWQVYIHAAEPAPAIDELDTDTTAALRDLTRG